MMSIIGSLIGFLGSAFPEALKIYQEKKDREHELTVLDKQMEQSKQGSAQEIREITVSADIAESKALYQHASLPVANKWVESLRASVRPVITYTFFMLFATIKITSLYALITQGVDMGVALKEVWDEETQALFATVITFWFGSRTLSKLRS